MKPNYLVQVKQSAGSIFVEDELETQVMTPAKLVQSTTASDLSIPIETFVPTNALNDIPLSRLSMLLLHAESVSANKLIVHHIAMLAPNTPVHDALCYGSRAFFVARTNQNTHELQSPGIRAIWPRAECCEPSTSPTRCTQQKSCGAHGNLGKRSSRQSMH